MLDSIKDYAQRFLNIDGETVDKMLDRCTLTKAFNDSFEIDISDCVPNSVYEEYPTFLLDNSEFESFINEFFSNMTREELLGWCVSIQGKVLLGKYMNHYGLVEL
jgi:hypothetical protein